MADKQVDPKEAAEMQQQMQMMAQMAAQMGDTHIRTSSWGKDAADVFTRRLTENAIPDGATGSVQDVEDDAESVEAELEDIHAEKDAIMDAFAKIDCEDNEDVECEEFVKGLQKLKVNLTLPEMKKVFNLMDYDDSNYVDRNEFCMFLTQRYESKQLSRLQEAILTAIRGDTGHNRKPSGMALRDQQRMMKKQMTMIMTKEVEKVTEEQKMIDAMEDEKKEKGDKFCAEEKAKEWTSNEVAAWLKTLEMEEYQPNFIKQKVIGAQLLYDFNEHNLQFDLLVKKVHVSKLLRGIQLLRDKVRKKFDEETFDVASYECLPMESAKERFEDYENKINEQKEEMEDLKREYERRIKKLLDDIKERDEIIKECEKQGFIQGENDKANLSEPSDDDMPPLEPAQDELENEDMKNSQIKSPNDTDNDDENDNEKLGRTESMIIHSDLADAISTEAAEHEPKELPSSLQPKKHHRKTTSLGGGRSRPPTGTKAYWLWIDEKKQANANFGSINRALEWTHHEIALWMKTIKCHNYVKQFVEERINGETLLKDLNSKVLNADLGVKMLHCGKIMREIEKLKHSAGIGFEISKFEDIKYYPNEEDSLQKKNETLQTKIDELETKYNEDIENNNKEYESKLDEIKEENNKLKSEIETLEQKIIELEKRKFTEEDEFDQEVFNPNNDDSKQDLNDKRFRTKKVRQLMEEIKKIMQDENIVFAQPNTASKWSYKEVCWWLNEIDMPIYIKSFMDHKIDGEILIRDLNQNILHDELNVKRFHCGKILREIEKIRLKTEDGLNISEFNNIIEYIPEFSAKDTISELKEENEKLDKSINELKENIQELENRPKIDETELIIKKDEFEELKSEKSRLEKQIDELEKKVQEAKEEAIPAIEKKQKMEKLDNLINELKNKKEENDNFAIEKNSLNWSNDEVLYWLYTIGCQEYVESFQKNNIIGSVIIKDLSTELLSSELGVKRLHLNQILREAEKLQSASFGLIISECNDIIYEPEKRAVDIFEDYENKINDLNKEIDEKNNIIEEKQGLVETEIGNNHLLNEKITELNNTIEKLKEEKQSEYDTSTKEIISNLEENINNLKNELEENKKNNETELEEVKKTNEEILNGKNSELEKLNNDYNELNEKYGQMSEKLKEYEEKEQEELKQDDEYKHSFEYQLKKRAEEDSTFGKPKLALKWTIEEVCYWLYQIKQPEYIDSFRELLVDGSMLLSDLSPDQLRSELGIKKYHLGKITREIEKLKDLAQAILVVSEFDEIDFESSQKDINDTINDLQTQLQQQKDINSALSLEVNNIKNLQQSYNMDNDSTKGNDSHNNNNKNDYDEEDEDDNKIDGNNMDIKQLNNEIDRLRIEKITLVENTAKEMNRLRRMVNVLSRAYEQLSGTPLGSFAQNQTVEQFFSMIGYGQKPKPKPVKRRYHY